MTSTVAPASPAATSQQTRIPALHLRPVVAIAAALVAVELAVAARYGLHRDELYFLACARHLAWGYVDQPPLVPAATWIAMHTFGASAVSLRILPALAAGTVVILTALIARELGGDRTAQVLGALAAATSPQVLGALHLMSTTSFDLLFWSLLTLVMLRILRTNDERLWVAFGTLTGVALLNKLNVAFLVAGLAIALLIDGERRPFRSKWLWTGALIAFVLWLPNVLWNAQHDWAAIEMVRSLHRENGGAGAVVGFIPSQFLVVGPVLVVFVLGGLRRLLSSAWTRSLAFTYLILLAWFTATGAKPYYLAGMYFVLFGAGGVWVEDRIARHGGRLRLRGWIALMLAGVVVALPLTLPVLPAQTLPKSGWEGNINKDLSATLGWKRFVGQIAAVAGSLTPSERAHLVVFAGDYGAAGALDLWGSRYGLPHAISGHNNYWWWRPQDTPDNSTTIAVNLSRRHLLSIFTQVVPAGTVTSPHNVWTEERGEPIWICRGQKVSWRGAWPAARHYG